MMQRLTLAAQIFIGRVSIDMLQLQTRVLRWQLKTVLNDGKVMMEPSSA